MLIKNILTLDLSEDIKNVIDLEDFSEAEIKSEIENYIITDGLAKEYVNFTTIFTTGIVETGVWISGFYGSGKSYFGKLLGYLLSNRMISGTPARDRIMQRFTGINDEALIKNTMAKLNSENCRVVFLDVAKQDNSKGLPFTLFRNFLKSLDLPENEHGILLFQQMLNEKYTDIHDFIYQKLNKNWSDIKHRLIEYSKASKAINLQNDGSESDYANLITTIRRDMDQFGASRLKDELSNYLKLVKNEKIVFLFDEASEAISQKKINLFDLEGVSESLSALGGKVWTIAIAQEKLDSVIREAGLNKAQLTKVTDRFKTKIHLEATEVDVIIRSRLLKKTNEAVVLLQNNYQANSGKIADHAGLNATGISKTDNLDSYITYYPFYKYQFDLLQNFLFGAKGLTSTKIAARGMIITTYDILKQELQHNKLFEVATGWQIAITAQNSPDARLVSRFDNAERILKETGSQISGRRLLETIHFLFQADVVPASLHNIVKSFINKPEDYAATQIQITKALSDLSEAKIILDSNKTYRITSDIEQRLLDEMVGFTVQSFVKKKQLVSAYKTSAFVKALARIADSNLQYDFFIVTDNDDELTSPQLKQLKIKIKSIYNISENRTNDIETLKVQHQNDKDIIWLVPDNSAFKEMDRLIDDIERITYLEQKYNNPNSEEGKILQSFSAAKSEKENRVKDIIEHSLQLATSVYLYNTAVLDKTIWHATLQNLQLQVIQNVYSKRLASQLSDTVALSVIKEVKNEKLQQYFNGKDFLFFDNHGIFIGDNLRVVEEIVSKIKNNFKDGLALEKELEQAPTGFAFGTVISTVAALMRAGKIMAKYNGSDKFSWRDEGVSAIFAPREFRKAAFKGIAKSLTAAQKQQIAQFLLDIDVSAHINKKIDYNTNDFDLVNAIRDLAKHFCEKVDAMKRTNKDFDTLFGSLEVYNQLLGNYTGAVSEANYIDKAEEFLKTKNAFLEALNAIEKVEKFIRNNLPKVREWNYFVIAVNDELTKAAKSNPEIIRFSFDFNKLFTNNIVTHFAELQQLAQKIKDEYHALFQDAVNIASGKYVHLKVEAEALISEINSLPNTLNTDALRSTNSVLQYAQQRTQSTVELGFDVKDKHSRFTYSEVLSFIDIYNLKIEELTKLKAGLIREEPKPIEAGEPTPPPMPKKIKVKMPAKSLKVLAFKEWLNAELQNLKSANDNDDIEILN